MPVATFTHVKSKILPLNPADRAARLAELKTTLAEKFPQAPATKNSLLPTGLAAIDQVEGGLRIAATTEISGSPAANSLLISGLLSMLKREGRFGALVDCRSFFDPGSFAPILLKRLLWVRSRTAAEAVKAADLLLRDGNLSVVILDLQGADMKGIPANTWHRFQRLAEDSSMAFAVLTQRPTVEGASVRFRVKWDYDFTAMGEKRRELMKGFEADFSARRSFSNVTVLNLKSA